MPGITLLGLGPGNPKQLSREAWETINTIDEIYVRTGQHPTIAEFPSSLQVNSFDGLYETSETFEDVYSSIVTRILELGQRPNGVVYAVPGDPFMAEATCPEIAKRALEMNLPLKVISGISFLEPVFAGIGLDPYPRLSLVDALDLSQAHIANFPPDVPVLVAQIYSQLIAAEVKMTLNTVYPDHHPVRLVHAAGTGDMVVENIPLYEIDRSPHIGLLTALYIPPLPAGTSFEAFQEIVAALRAPDGCPWDREQTHQSLRSNLIEETYEALEAIDSKDPVRMAEEFGDLLLQIVLNAQIASEEGDFAMTEVLQGIHDKIIRRHPHVFGDMVLEDVDGVLQNWEKMKAEERKNARKQESLLAGVPVALPALIQAQEYQDRAARVGFDWPEIGGVLEKISEEVLEVRNAKNTEELAEELGDLFFALVNLSRWKKVDAESALRGTNKKFKERFVFIEEEARRQGKSLSSMSLNEMEALWQEAKRGNNSTG